MSKEIQDFSMDVFSVEGKVVMITGGNMGLGMAYATALAKAGADIFIPHFTPDTDEARAAVEGQGRKIGFVQGDLTKPEDRQAAVDACLEQFGRIDVLINNAGCNYAAPYCDFPDEQWKKVIDLQLEAVHYMSHLVAPVMIERGGGKIINIASALSFAADLNATAYTVAKHGVVGITRSVAAECGRLGVTCNAIAPGFFATSVNDCVREMNPGLYQKVCDRISIKGEDGWGSIYDLLGPIVFLCSPASDYVNGEVLVVDGGFKAQMV